MRKFLLAPSVFGADLLNIEKSINSLENTFDWLHVDIMDGHFVRNLSLGVEHVRELRKKYPDSFLDVHLMIDELETLLPLFLKAGSSSITLHAEAEPHLLHASLKMIKDFGLKAGIALCPPTKVASLDESVLELADLILVMSVTPGFGGQKFIQSSMKKVNELVSLRAANKNFNYLIEIDGGINENNAAEIILGGCDVLVIGSALFKNENPASWLENVRAKIKEELKDFDGK